MNQKRNLAANATKIKKWLEAVEQLQTGNHVFALPITKLTSIKSLCDLELAAERFALYISQKVQQQMNLATHPDELSQDEWETHKHLVDDAVLQMENYSSVRTYERRQGFRAIIQQIDELQGNDYKRVHWTTVHFVRSGYLLKIEYALRCFIGIEFSYWAYKLAKEYVECYEPRYGTGLTPQSVPMLLEVAEFWCQYYFEQSLEDKFYKFFKN